MQWNKASWSYIQTYLLSPATPIHLQLELIASVCIVVLIAVSRVTCVKVGVAIRKCGVVALSWGHVLQIKVEGVCEMFQQVQKQGAEINPCMVNTCCSAMHTSAVVYYCTLYNRCSSEIHRLRQALSPSLVFPHHSAFTNQGMNTVCTHTHNYNHWLAPNTALYVRGMKILHVMIIILYRACKRYQYSYFSSWLPTHAPPFKNISKSSMAPMKCTCLKK